MDPRPALPRRLRILVVLVVLSAIPAAATEVGSQQRQRSAKDLDCAAAKRGQTLRQEQSSVLDQVGRLAVLRNRADLAALGRPPLGFNSLLHQFTSFEGIGMTVFNPTAQLAPGSPNFLFYAPSKRARDTKDPRGPDFPYTLVGWAYGVPYTPGRLPSFLPCVGAKDWHIHERGIHPYKTGGMIPMPPAEAGFGESAGQLSDPPALRPIVGFPHPRTWTTHFWRGADGAAESAILDPSDPPDGVDSGEGSSFYFLDEPPTGILDATANRGRPVALQDGEGQKEVFGGNEYTLKVAAFQSGGLFSQLDATFKRDGQLGGPLATAYYILSGRMTFESGGQRLPASKGSFVYIPGSPPGGGYSFTVDSAGPARAIMLSAPGGIERALGFPPPAIPGGGGGGGGSQAPPATAKQKPFVLRPGEGETVFIRDAKYIYKAKTEDTGGAITVMETTIPRGSAPGQHIHHREFESFYLLDGEVTFQTGGQTLPALKGGLGLLPLGLPHQYTIDNDEAKLILVGAPAGLDKFFRVLGTVSQPTAAQSLKFGVEPVIPPSQQKK
jgi:quercetin dioxygenase-like cupin family protein